MPNHNKSIAFLNSIIIIMIVELIGGGEREQMIENGIVIAINM